LIAHTLESSVHGGGRIAVRARMTQLHCRRLRTVSVTKTWKGTKR